jgi:hypothetical protein
MSVISFDVAAFRVSFPAFASVTAYPDATLQMYWDNACLFVRPNTSVCLVGALAPDRKERILNLLTAHLAQLATLIALGQTPGQVQSSTVDKVSVSLTPPPQETQFQWWLGLTPYGQQVLALLQVASVGGFYIGGLPERAPFHKVAGIV